MEPRPPNREARRAGQGAGPAGSVGRGATSYDALETRWAENGVALCEAPGVQHTPDGAPDGTGGAIFAWVDGRSGGAHDIYASGLATDGDLAPGWIPNGNPVCSADGIQSYPRVVSDGMGGALLAWIDGRNGATALYAQHLLSSGGRRDLRDPEERGRE